MTLFARAFLLVGALLVVSVLASFQLYLLYEREPRSRELAQQTVSVVNLTRAALISADPYRRRELLIELNEREGIRIYPVTAAEALEPLPDSPLFARVAARVRDALGGRTRFAFARDGEAGFWVSFFIDVDEFWVMLPRERFELRLGARWLAWGAALLALALAGAWLIASRIARPLAALADAAHRIGRGEAHGPLDEAGPRELGAVAPAFNRMARDLEALERERALVLAGISHDLRTPLSRLRLALEMSGAQPEARAAIAADVEEIDAIIGQFLDYARGGDEPLAEGDLDALAQELAEAYRQRQRDVACRPGGLPPLRFAPRALRRALANLVDNALRYAGGAVELATRREPGRAVLEVLDRGPGIAERDAERLKRPFTRGDEARSGPAGAGLGLAIVERIARAHGGALELAARPGGGLAARIVLPA